MSDERPFWFNPNQAFAQAGPADELLHPERNRLIESDSATETQYFGFCIPAERIQGFCYLWHHPNLRVVSGGLFVFRRHKPTVVHGELCDFRCYMNDSVLRNDLREYRLENGYGVKVIEPLARHELSYSDPARGNSVNLRFAALMPPVMFGDGNHFEQAVKVSGELTLRGKTHAVDCFSVRDRSWGKARPESNPAAPSVSWMVGVFGEDLAFSATVFDQADTAPELSAELARPLEKSLTGGWLYRDGRLGRLTAARKRIVRAAGTFVPMYVELDIGDEHGRRIQLRGNCTASAVWQVWANTLLPICQMRWECDGRIAFGECQEGNFNDHLNQLSAG